mgnify:CR=1 FL=1
MDHHRPRFVCPGLFAATVEIPSVGFHGRRRTYMASGGLSWLLVAFVAVGGLLLRVEGLRGLCRAFIVVVGRASDRSRAVYRTTCRAGADEASKYG